MAKCCTRERVEVSSFFCSSFLAHTPPNVLTGKGQAHCLSRTTLLTRAEATPLPPPPVRRPDRAADPEARDPYFVTNKLMIEEKNQLNIDYHCHPFTLRFTPMMCRTFASLVSLARACQCSSDTTAFSLSCSAPPHLSAVGIEGSMSAAAHAQTHTGSPCKHASAFHALARA